MPIWAVTGKLGSGKTLVSVSRIQKYLNQNRRVATNLDLKLEKLINPWAENTDVIRVPDVPSVDDFVNMGLGYEGKFQGDDKNGLLVLDECAKWLNSRNWNDKNRAKLIDYFVHLRKKRWDLLLIIQDIEALDKQFRDLYCEHIVYCSRSDRYGIPYIGWFLKLIFGEKIPLPRVHIGNVYYNLGAGKQSHIENWMYRGNSIMEAYNTEQGFNAELSPAIYCYLPPNTVYGRYVSKIQKLKDALKGISIYHIFFVGLLSGGGLVKAYSSDGNSPDRGHFVCNSDWKSLFGDCELSKAEIKKAYKQFLDQKNGVLTSSDSEPLGSQADDKETLQHPLTDVYISGSVRLSENQFDYVFNKGDETFHPWENGYRVYDMGECSAMLLNIDDRNDTKKITCVDGEKL